MLRSLALGLALLLGGCPYITRRAYEAERDTLDEDGDGVDRAQDCDDQDSAKAPGTTETPYDGVDNDCDGADLLDMDGDGFAGIGQEEYEAKRPEVPYPDAFVGLPVDCADDPSLLVNAEDVFPDDTRAIEIPYDGVDSDCQGDNDFDNDRDGYVPDTVEQDGVDVATADALATYLTDWGLDDGSWGPAGVGPPLPDDCDDNDADVHPDNAIPEVWYDGVDRDCDDHNDFDQDGDGFMPSAAQGLYDDYVLQVYDGDPPPFDVDPDAPYADCLDEVDPGKVSYPDGVPADPAAVHPDTAAHPNPADAPYDAVDADCGRDNDFDADDDAFVLDTLNGTSVLVLMGDYADAWGYDQATVDSWAGVNPEAGLTTPATGDCDDGDATSWPGALELLGDGVDQDCDTEVDTSRFGFGDAAGDFDWTVPTNPEVVRIGDTYLVMAGAEQAYLPDPLDEVGATFLFRLGDARGGAVPSEDFITWKPGNVNLQIQAGLDVVLDAAPPDLDFDGEPDPVVRTASNSDNAATAYTYLNVGGHRYMTASGDIVPAESGTTFSTDPFVARSIDLVADAGGGVFALVCASQVAPVGYLNAQYFDPSIPLANDLVIDTQQGDTCFFDGAPRLVTGDYVADFTLCEAEACTSWTVDEAPSFTGGAAILDDWVFGDNDEGWISLIDGAGAGWVRDASGVAADLRVFPTDTVDHLDVSVWDGTIYAAAIISNEVWLQHGTAGNFDYVALPFDDPSLLGEDPTSVAVYADADRVAVAVSAVTGIADRDSVGWVFLGPPP